MAAVSLTFRGQSFQRPPLEDRPLAATATLTTVLKERRATSSVSSVIGIDAIRGR